MYKLYIEEGTGVLLYDLVEGATYKPRYLLRTHLLYNIIRP
jgi:hypothetical protein